MRDQYSHIEDSIKIGILNRDSNNPYVDATREILQKKTKKVEKIELWDSIAKVLGGTAKVPVNKKEAGVQKRLLENKKNNAQSNNDQILVIKTELLIQELQCYIENHFK